MAMNYQIVIEQVTESRSSTGAVVDTWSTLETVFADVEQLSGNENFVSEMTVYYDIKKFIVYYTSGQNVTPKMRISYDGGKYYITSVSHKNRLKTELIAVRNDDE
jgi:SPP1 family predicted phage head-tail adaptor